MPQNQLTINYRVDKGLPWETVHAHKLSKPELYSALLEVAEAYKAAVEEDPKYPLIETYLTIGFADSLDDIAATDSAHLLTVEEYLTSKGISLARFSKSDTRKLQNKVGLLYRAKYHQPPRKVYRPGKNSRHTRKVNAYRIPEDVDIIKEAYDYMLSVTAPLPDRLD